MIIITCGKYLRNWKTIWNKNKNSNKIPTPNNTKAQRLNTVQQQYNRYLLTGLIVTMGTVG